MTEVITQVIMRDGMQPPRIGALSGPSFALEAARGDPTAITIASQDTELARTVQQEFSNASFRVYTNEDPIGVELGGALKNTIAIAAGVSAGLGLGHNSIAALITRGLAEMTRLVVACGGKAETLAGLAGLGDLVAHLHRRALPQSQRRCRTGPRTQVAGDSCRDAWNGGGRNLHYDGRSGAGRMPAVSRCRITEQMHAILHEGKSPREAISDLMARRGRSETLRT